MVNALEALLILWGGVYTPEGEISPTVSLPPEIPFTDQVTSFFKGSDTLAEKEMAPLPTTVEILSGVRSTVIKLFLLSFNFSYSGVRASSASSKPERLNSDFKKSFMPVVKAVVVEVSDKGTFLSPNVICVSSWVWVDSYFPSNRPSEISRLNAVTNVMT